MKDTAQSEKAVICHMVTDDNIYPYGIKIVDLHKRKGVEIEGNWLTNPVDYPVFRLCEKVSGYRPVSGRRLSVESDVFERESLCLRDKKSAS